MKHLLYMTVATVLSAFLTTGCSKAYLNQETTVPEEDTHLCEMTFTASFGDGSTTRTTVSAQNDKKVLWSPKDEIKLFYRDTDARFTSTNEEAAAVADFSGMVTTLVGGDESFAEDGFVFHALYPYQEAATFDGKQISATLDANQRGPEGSFQDDRFITLARSKNTSLAFYNVCSGLRFKLSWDDISKVTVSAFAGESLAGSFITGFDEETGVPAIYGVTGGKSTITLTPEEGQYFKPDVWYYLVSLPAELEKGFTVTLTGGNTLLFSYEKAVSFNRGKFRSVSLTPDNTFYDLVNIQERAFIRDASLAYPGDPDYSSSIVRQYYLASGASQYPNAIKLGTEESLVCSGETDSAVRISGNNVLNLVPGVRYTWQNGSESGSFTPVGPLRTLYITRVANVRDLGGWKAGDKRIRYGRLFRGGHLDSNVSMDELNALGIAVDMDLRGARNASGQYQGSGPANNTSLEYYNFPVQMFLTPPPSFTIFEPGMSSDMYQAAIRTIINCLEYDKPVYFHCHGGADRTGTLAFFIEMLLGVSEVDASIDYELTSFYNSSHLRQRNETNFNNYPFRSLITYLQANFEGDTMQEKVYNWATTPYHDQYSENNGVREFFEPALTEEEIGRLRELLLE